MSFKEYFSRLQRAGGRFLLKSTRWVVNRLSYPVFRALAGVLFFIGQLVMAKKRNLAMENLKMAFGNEKTDDELQKIAGKCFNSFGKGMIDLIYFLDRPKRIVEKVSIEGREHLEQVLKEGKGAIMVSAHFGDFILMYLRMVLEGYPTNVIMRRTRDPEFEKYISDYRNQMGIKTIYDLPPRKCVQQCIKALRNNEILIILLDQNYGGAGRVFVDFFGRQAATAAGPVVFSTRTDAPVLPMFIMSDGPSRYKIVIRPPVALEQRDNDEEMFTVNTAKLTKIIEGVIRQHPHEWGGWMHRRWKARTRAEQTVIDRMNEERRRKKKIWSLIRS